VLYAPFAQADDSLADPVTNRIYGFITGQGVAVASSWIGSALGWSALGGAADQSLTGARLSGTWQTVVKVSDMGNITTTSLLCAGGYRVPLTMPMQIFGGACFGWARNMRILNNDVERAAVLDAAGLPVGYFCGYSTSTAGNGFAFRTGAP